MKIVWALDAFERPSALQRSAAMVLRYLEKHVQLVVEPVFVMTPAQLNLSIEFNGPWVHHYRPAAEKALKSLLKELRVNVSSRVTVLTQDYSSTAHAVDALSKFAFSEQADLILVSTHGRTGLSRIFLGSFAETLVLRSLIPVMSIGPNVQGRGNFEKILFATEFGRYSKQMFRHAISLAQTFGAELIFYHSIPHPIEPVFQSGVYLLGGSWVPVQSYFNSEIDRQKRRAEAWARWSRQQGVKTEVVIDTRGEQISRSVVDLCKRNSIGLIVLEAQSGPIASAIVGSVTRQLMHEAPCPVWTMRSQLLEKEISPKEGAKKAA